jgi:hypothetical protein
MIRRIALTLCVAVLAGAASLPETASSNDSSTVKNGTMDVAAHSAHRSGYIVASS